MGKVISIAREQTDYFFKDDEDADINEINIPTFLQLKQSSNTFVLDVREWQEHPKIDFADAQIPMSQLNTALHHLPEKEICVICHLGIRSKYAAQIIQQNRNLKVYSVKGGITAYFNQIT